MNRTTAVLMLLGLLAAAGCRGRRADGPGPDYGATRDAAERAHHSLDQERDRSKQ